MAFENDPALRVQATADALATAFAAISGVTALSYDPIGVEIDTPFICVGETRGQGTALETLAHQLARDDQLEEWTVTLYHHLDDPATDWASARAIIGQMTAAIDIDWQLGGQVREARITEWALRVADAEATGTRRMLHGEITVHLLYLMPNPT